jgi:glycosyltransferase involved in cell wall biosynthesis
MQIKKQLIVMGIRGVPAQHGGFETFAEYLCPFMMGNGWSVIVYCQEDGRGPYYESEWDGVKRIHIPVNNSGAFGTVIFDLKSVIHSLRHKGVFLTLGYNTAIFNILHRAFGKKNIINMDGIEWRRQKWGTVAKCWFWLNERFGCWFGNHLVADHPRIEDHLATRVSCGKITMIPYGGLEVSSADENILSEYDLVKNEYAIVIARPEPENSILEIVSGFSKKERCKKLVVLGNYDSENAYHRAVLNAASDEVVFLGAIYDVEKVSALRFFSTAYVHGHQVGGTNPSLVESIGAGNAIVAHDNLFNRWVAQDGALYFSDEKQVSVIFDDIFTDDQMVESLKENTRRNFIENFQWGSILSQYESLLSHYIVKGSE